MYQPAPEKAIGFLRVLGLAKLLAKISASDSASDSVTVAHFLLAILIMGRGIAFKALQKLGVDLEGLKQDLVDQISPKEACPEFSEAAADLVPLADQISQTLNRPCCGSESLLLAIIEQADESVLGVLFLHDINLPKATAMVNALLDDAMAIQAKAIQEAQKVKQPPPESWN